MEERDPVDTAPTRATPGARQWQLTTIAFLASACVMALELAVQRIVAPYVGMSLHTWTVVIGVVLAGTSLGNVLGGRLADRWSSPRLLGAVLAGGGLAALSILGMDVLNAFTSLDGINRETLPLILALTAFAVTICLLPCIVLGMASPVIARLAVRDLDHTGQTVGRIYAAGALGSIAGTFAAGFFLISWFGTHAVVWGVTALLLALGLPLLLAERRPWLIPAAAVTAAISLLAFRQGWLEGPCTRETNYYCIIVRDTNVSGKPVRALILDRLIHSYSSLDDPTALAYGYERIYAEATAYQAARKGGLRALFVGGGGYTFPRYMEALYPDSELDVIEIDPGVTAIAYEMLGLDRGSDVASYNEDARTYLARPPTTQYDLIYGDAFNDYSVPYHLTTKGFNERVRAWLAEDGLYVVNIIDGPYGRFLRAYLHTLQQSFEYVHPIFSLEAWQNSSRTTIVILASDQPLDETTLQAAAPDLASEMLRPEETAGLLAGGRAVTLTDRYAPVDQLLLPVFLDQIRR
jgi:spermidine synthase